MLHRSNHQLGLRAVFRYLLAIFPLSGKVLSLRDRRERSSLYSSPLSWSLNDCSRNTKLGSFPIGCQKRYHLHDQAYSKITSALRTTK